MANCLVLGANGFLGSHLVDSLVARGHKVRAFDRFSNGAPLYNAHENVEQYVGDFLNRYSLAEALKDIDHVFHFISTTTPITAENDPLIDVDTNIRMSVELFDECVKQNVKKVIFASTGGSIYGIDAGEEPISEDVTPRPISPYAIGKLTIEHYLHYFERKFGLSSVVFRISNPYGERQALNSKQGVIPIFLQHIHNNEPITIFGDGEMVRDYIYVKDVVEMIAESYDKANNNLYNLGSGHGVSLNHLVEEIEKVVEHPFEVNHQPNLSTFVDKVVLDVSRFQQEFQPTNSTSLQDGIRKTWNYINERLKD